MSSFLLFCIAQVPVATINALLLTPRYNFFSLVRNAAQSSFDPQCTTPPVQSFETGFSNSSREQIRDFITQRLPTAPIGTFLEPGQYALLDERSARDNTVVLGTAYSSLHDRDPDTMTAEELEQWHQECEANLDAPKDMWREFRVKFDEAEKLSTILTLESDFTPKLYNDEFVVEHTDEQGVFLVQRAQCAYEASEESDDR